MQKGKIQVGDLIRFLNAVGGGRVARIEGDTAWISDEDGFEIPTLIKECIVVEQDNTFVPAYKPPVISERVAEIKAMTAQPRHETHFQQQPELRATYLPGKDKVSLYMAVLPPERGELGIDPYDLYLINDSNYTLYYTLALPQPKGNRLLGKGEISANTQLHVADLSPRLLPEIDTLEWQCLAYDSKDYHPQGSWALSERIDARKLLRKQTFIPNEFFDEDAWVRPLIIEGHAPSTQSIAEESTVAEQILTPRRQHSAPARKSSNPAKSKPNEPLVIDLHIDKLLDSTQGMESKDILTYQIDHFHRVMQSSLHQRGSRIIFIHGKGEGVLRRNIEQELKHKYKSCKWQDASFAQYSYGATQVTIG